MPENYLEQSRDIQARMSSMGLTLDHLKMIGAFIVAYGLFETTLERALWALIERRAANEANMLFEGNV